MASLPPVLGQSAIGAPAGNANITGLPPGLAAKVQAGQLTPEQAQAIMVKIQAHGGHHRGGHHHHHLAGGAPVGLQNPQQGATIPGQQNVIA